MADTVHRHLPFLHSFQKGRLGTGGSPVQLVCQKQVAQHRTGAVYKPACLLIRHAVAGHIRGQHIRVKLHPVLLQTHGSGKGQRHGGLAHPGNILHQNVSTG